MQESHASTGNRVWMALRSQLLRFVLKRVRDKALAEDIVHDTLYKAYTQQDTLRESQRLRPWLYQITRNTIADHYRSQRLWEPLSDVLIAEEVGDDRRAERELARCLRPLIDKLPAQYGRAVKLVELEGMKQRGAASVLGLSLSGAKSRIQRARKMLADSLLDCCRIEVDRRGSVVDYECRKPGDNCCESVRDGTRIKAESESAG
jgi:RNA polymerase sigma-70 factor (ECF subfamily)